MGKGGPRPAYEIRPDSLPINISAIDPEDAETNLYNHLIMPVLQLMSSKTPLKSEVNDIDLPDDENVNDYITYNDEPSCTSSNMNNNVKEINNLQDISNEQPGVEFTRRQLHIRHAFWGHHKDVHFFENTDPQTNIQEISEIEPHESMLGSNPLLSSLLKTHLPSAKAINIGQGFVERTSNNKGFVDTMSTNKELVETMSNNLYDTFQENYPLNIKASTIDKMVIPEYTSNLNQDIKLSFKKGLYNSSMNRDERHINMNIQDVSEDTLPSRLATTQQPFQGMNKSNVNDSNFNEATKPEFVVPDDDDERLTHPPILFTDMEGIQDECYSLANNCIEQIRSQSFGGSQTSNQAGPDKNYTIDPRIDLTQSVWTNGPDIMSFIEDETDFRSEEDEQRLKEVNQQLPKDRSHQIRETTSRNYMSGSRRIRSQSAASFASKKMSQQNNMLFTAAIFGCHIPGAYSDNQESSRFPEMLSSKDGLARQNCLLVNQKGRLRSLSNSKIDVSSTDDTFNRTGNTRMTEKKQWKTLKPASENFSLLEDNVSTHSRLQQMKHKMNNDYMSIEMSAETRARPSSTRFPTMTSIKEAEITNYNPELTLRNKIPIINSSPQSGQQKDLHNDNKFGQLESQSTPNKDIRRFSLTSSDNKKFSQTNTHNPHPHKLGNLPWSYQQERPGINKSERNPNTTNASGKHHSRHSTTETDIWDNLLTYSETTDVNELSQNTLFKNQESKDKKHKSLFSTNLLKNKDNTDKKLKASLSNTLLSKYQDSIKKKYNGFLANNLSKDIENTYAQSNKFSSRSHKANSLQSEDNNEEKKSKQSLKKDVFDNQSTFKTSQDYKKNKFILEMTPDNIKNRYVNLDNGDYQQGQDLSKSEKFNTMLTSPPHSEVSKQPQDIKQNISKQNQQKQPSALYNRLLKELISNQKASLIKSSQVSASNKEAVSGDKSNEDLPAVKYVSKIVTESLIKTVQAPLPKRRNGSPSYRIVSKINIDKSDVREDVRVVPLAFYKPHQSPISTSYGKAVSKLGKISETTLTPANVMNLTNAQAITTKVTLTTKEVTPQTSNENISESNSISSRFSFARKKVENEGELLAKRKHLKTRVTEFGEKGDELSNYRKHPQKSLKETGFVFTKNKGARSGHLEAEYDAVMSVSSCNLNKQLNPTSKLEANDSSCSSLKSSTNLLASKDQEHQPAGKNVSLITRFSSMIMSRLFAFSSIPKTKSNFGHGNKGSFVSILGQNLSSSLHQSLSIGDKFFSQTNSMSSSVDNKAFLLKRLIFNETLSSPVDAPFYKRQIKNLNDCYKHYQGDINKQQLNTGYLGHSKINELSKTKEMVKQGRNNKLSVYSHSNGVIGQLKRQKSEPIRGIGQRRTSFMRSLDCKKQSKHPGGAQIDNIKLSGNRHLCAQKNNCSLVAEDSVNNKESFLMCPTTLSETFDQRFRENDSKYHSYIPKVLEKKSVKSIQSKIGQPFFPQQNMSCRSLLQNLNDEAIKPSQSSDFQFELPKYGESLSFSGSNSRLGKGHQKSASVFIDHQEIQEERIPTNNVTEETDVETISGWKQQKELDTVLTDVLSVAAREAEVLSEMRWRHLFAENTQKDSLTQEDTLTDLKEEVQKYSPLQLSPSTYDHISTKKPNKSNVNSCMLHQLSLGHQIKTRSYSSCKLKTSDKKTSRNNLALHIPRVTKPSRDIITLRAMNPPFNTAITEEDERYKLLYGSWKVI